MPVCKPVWQTYGNTILEFDKANLIEFYFKMQGISSTKYYYFPQDQYPQLLQMDQQSKINQFPWKAAVVQLQGTC